MHKSTDIKSYAIWENWIFKVLSEVSVPINDKEISFLVILGKEEEKKHAIQICAVLYSVFPCMKGASIVSFNVENFEKALKCKKRC